MRLFRNWGITDFELPMIWAANNGCGNVMRPCREWGATDVDTAMVWAASGGYEFTVCLCFDWDAQERPGYDVCCRRRS